LPGELRAQALPLKPDEIAALVREDAESADRFQFVWRGITGTMILVPSTTWRAHHRPERCLQVLGLQINDSRAVMVAPDFAVRLVAVGQRGGDERSATYWFQSATRTTDDYGTRLWADLAPRRARWVLVSVLFDRALDPSDADVRAFYLALRDGIAQNLNR
jgi:exosortase O